jgi:hypothetical protein
MFTRVVVEMPMDAEVLVMCIDVVVTDTEEDTARQRELAP